MGTKEKPQSQKRPKGKEEKGSVLGFLREERAGSRRTDHWAALSQRERSCHQRTPGASRAPTGALRHFRGPSQVGRGRVELSQKPSATSWISDPGPVSQLGHRWPARSAPPAGAPGYPRQPSLGDLQAHPQLSQEFSAHSATPKGRSRRAYAPPPGVRNPRASAPRPHDPQVLLPPAPQDSRHPRLPAHLWAWPCAPFPAPPLLRLGGGARFGPRRGPAAAAASATCHRPGRLLLPRPRTLAPPGRPRGPAGMPRQPEHTRRTLPCWWARSGGA